MPNNIYTGTLNDPIQQAQHRYLGDNWEKYFEFLNGKRLAPQSLGIMAGASKGLLARPGEEDIVRSGAANAYAAQLADENRLRHQSELDMGAHNRAVDAAENDRQAAQRAMAIANDPGTSQFGAPIVKAPDGSYATVPRQPTGPVDRRAVAAQMAPGLIAPPPPPKPVTYDNPKTMTVGGKQALVRMGSDGVPYDMARRPIDPNTIEPEDKTATANPDVADAVAGMMNGTLPPQLPGRASKEYLAIMGEAKRQGYDLAGAATDWTATQKHVQTMNGAQQLRLNQAVNSLPEMLDSVETLAKQWKAGGFPLLNKASLAIAKNGGMGPEAASIATRLDGQIADVVADLGNVYMGGNSPTERALELAGKSLKSEWSEKVLLDNIDMARKNVQIRKNSIANTGVSGASPGNPYGNQPPAGSAGTIRAVDPQGNVHEAKAGTPLPPGWKLQ